MIVDMLNKYIEGDGVWQFPAEPKQSHVSPS